MPIEETPQGRSAVYHTGLMIVTAALYVLISLIPTQAESRTSRLTVTQGETLTLRCVFPRGDCSAMQWLTPGGYVTFFNGEKVLKDRRYQLVQHLRNKLIIRLSNVTAADGGVYTCLYYSSPVQRKKVEVTVLAVPSQPVIEVLQVPGKDKYVVNCSTSESWPCPRLTWLIDSGHTEVSGNKKVTIDSDGKRCTASSALRINAFSHLSTTRCIVRHRTLSPGNLTASYKFHVLSTVTESQITQQDGITEQDSPQYTVYVFRLFWKHINNKKVFNVSSVKYLPSNVVMCLYLLVTVSAAEIPERNTTLGAEDPITGENGTTEAATLPPLSEGHTTLEIDVPITRGDGTTETITLTPLSERNTTLGTDDPITRRNETTEAVTLPPSSEGYTTLGINIDTTSKNNHNLSSEFDDTRRKSHNTLVLLLVSLMICVLLVIVYLFLVKLKKAHSTWKKENEVSDQTLESTKSRSNNEDTSGQAKIAAQVTTNKSVAAIQYNNQVSVDAEAPCPPPPQCEETFQSFK
ncbi:cytotoxic and regulatory T-cell molecule [Mixophyes fleayi]|uniref:cytotoxic and regulatory T-cell molecule n=1 Tax=Mixophyes fleayi TaxID=3061075 RepID=UPI003F4DFB5C